ncbi:hypothetical protein L249_4712, partial [Ophiocordyceps polyrhachis-furcata BCC 54312]
KEKESESEREEKEKKGSLGPRRTLPPFGRARAGPNGAMETPVSIIQWALDTRPLWPSATETRDLKQAASREFNLLNDKETEQIQRFHFVKDAKLALASALLKRLAISRLANVSWTEASSWKRDVRTGKPIFDMPRSSSPSSSVKKNKKKKREGIKFNVSHQAGVVVLVASSLVAQDDDDDDDDDDQVGEEEEEEEEDEKKLDVGIDVVCQGERREKDLTSIAAEGWSRYVAVHEDVFSPHEAAALRSREGDDDDSRLAYFYTLWCLREAYIKMTGDALLAPWLKDLEMRHFAPPPPSSSLSDQHHHHHHHHHQQNSTSHDPRLEIWFRGRRVEDVCMRLSSLLEDEYVVCTAVRCPPRLRACVESQLALPFTHLVLDDMVTEAEEADRRGQLA